MTANGHAALALELPDELLDAITERVMERMANLEEREPEGFLDVAGAAEFLACPKSRIYSLVSAGRLPHHKDGSRVLFTRDELRAYVANGGARRP